MRHVFNLTANETQTKGASGDYVAVRFITGLVRVTCFRESVVVGQFTFDEPGSGTVSNRYDRIEITDLSGAANAVQLLVGTGSFTSNKFSGDVSWTDPQPVKFNNAQEVSIAVVNSANLTAENGLKTASGPMRVLSSSSGGAIIHAASVLCENGASTSNARMEITSGSAASQLNPVICECLYTPNCMVSFVLPKPVQIPTGKQVYIQTSAAQNIRYHIAYELL